MNVFYVLMRTTENCEFDRIRTAGVTGNATNDKNSQGENPICSTRDEILLLSRPISPRATTAVPEKEIFIMIALDGHELSACIHAPLTCGALLVASQWEDLD